MNFYPEAYIVDLIVPFVDLNDVAVTPTALRAMLYDGEDLLLGDFGTIDITGASEQKTITIPAIYNSLSGTEIREARVLKIEMDTAAGMITLRHAYVIEAEQTLEIMNNTFQTFETAEIAAMNFVNLEGWDTAEDARKRAALAEAYSRIIRIPMKYSVRDDLGQNIVGGEQMITRYNWGYITQEAFTAFPTHFRKALRAAQLLEANELLTGDEVGRRHRAGIVTETIGESSVTLRAGQISFGISKPSMNVLAGYIAYSNVITRV